MQAKWQAGTALFCCHSKRNVYKWCQRQQWSICKRRQQVSDLFASADRNACIPRQRVRLQDSSTRVVGERDEVMA